MNYDPKDAREERPSLDICLQYYGLEFTEYDFSEIWDMDAVMPVIIKEARKVDDKAVTQLIRYTTKLTGNEAGFWEPCAKVAFCEQLRDQFIAPNINGPVDAYALNEALLIDLRGTDKWWEGVTAQ